jgi:hypothetical protein
LSSNIAEDISIESWHFWQAIPLESLSYCVQRVSPFPAFSLWVSPDAMAGMDIGLGAG